MEGVRGFVWTGEVLDVEGEEGAEVEFLEDVVVEEVGCYLEDYFGGEGGEVWHW